MKRKTLNRANLTEEHARKVSCDSCYNTLTFAMRDNYHDFFLDLITVLKCLKLAEQEECVPPLPVEWWRHIKTLYRL